ncbi:MAG: permease-like cell division protein FtsX [Lachnospiraceae bacterium]|nr:permease-like cell division protein FtsX [Lachnospiraceae bacterium]MBR3171788.1 permease-like cell division protein FtsX [Lachnospiraceae bacterium]MBR3200477.1 permease-like cell division protein FtsX [Mogibacterium sp.]
MKIRSLGYCVRQGFKNIWRNRMFSVASITTMTACILLFGMFFSVLMNVNFMIRTLEEEVGVTVLFDEGLEQEKIDEIGEKIRAMEHVTDVTYTSAEEAWENFQQEYFEGNEEYAKSFSENGENPLANSASYTVRVDEIENQNSIVTRIKRLEGVRQVNQSAGATKTLISFNSLFTYVAVAIIALLLVVSIFLIANTVNVGISVRRHEIAIMKLIGATDSFVRAPFIVEGLLLGLIGSLIPLGILFVAYDRILGWLLNRFGVLNTISGSLPSVLEVFHVLAPVGVALGLGIGLIGSIITVRRHLRV